ncbi:molecular chaperone SurA [Spiribacter sp. C176]|uniref:Chaperone SurA n=1 Tax=Spiribacter salilacus TaxID=2664894 RepID=A0A6N7QSM3_9GAMM|nr:peptidylprolyl isomerase [Spiribacter salilacus]MRH78600.1 molecular chaperone SurA [Spiribacter salilacus]
MRRAVLAAWLLVFSALSAQAEEVLLERIVAVVNDTVILSSELEAEQVAVRLELQERGVQMPPDDELRRQVLERLITQQLQLNQAERLGIQVDSTTLDAAVRRVAENNNLSLTGLRDALATEGLNMAEFREQIRREIVISRLRQQVMSQRIDVTEQEIEQFMERSGGRGDELRLGQILIGVPEAASADTIDEARARAESIREQLLDGADFSSLAAAESDASNALNGGDLGWRLASQLPSAINEALSGLEAGDISPVIRTPSGFQILRISDKRDGDLRIVEQTKARHILISPDEIVTNTDARLRAESLHLRIANGADFAELARANSDDVGSASNGGELGWFDPASMLPEFADEVTRLSPGELSEPFRTSAGWHIVEVLDRREVDASESMAREEAAESVRRSKEEEETELWLRELREEAYVEIRLDTL